MSTDKQADKRGWPTTGEFENKVRMETGYAPDIVGRLRDTPIEPTPISRLVFEAAAEIERLRQMLTQPPVVRPERVGGLAFPRPVNQIGRAHV